MALDQREKILKRESGSVWGRHYWARGYFCVTSGELTKDMIEMYLAHHFERNPSNGFDVEQSAVQTDGQYYSGHEIPNTLPYENGMLP